MINYFNIPGLGNSGDNHWQTYLEKQKDNVSRINQNDWETPDCEDWIQTIDKAISNTDLDTVVLIGHSLGCSAIIHWARKFNRKIKGAVLVAPSDIEADKYKTLPTRGFAPIPKEKVNFKTIVVASSDDDWVSLERAQYFAKCWGSEFINIGKAGHINTDAGYGIWKEGIKIIESI